MLGFGKKVTEKIPEIERVPVYTIHQLNQPYEVIGGLFVHTTLGNDVEVQYQAGLDQLGKRAKETGADAVIGLVVTSTFLGTFIIHGTAIKLQPLTV